MQLLFGAYEMLFFARRSIQDMCDPSSDMNFLRGPWWRLLSYFEGNVQKKPPTLNQGCEKKRKSYSMLSVSIVEIMIDITDMTTTGGVTLSLP